MDSLGGYRIVRKLGAGTHSDVWLGNDGAELAAIKVFRSGVPLARVDSEIEAMARVSSRHIVRLDDLAMDRHGVPCLIMPRLSQLSLGRLLLAGRRHDGEAVTILAPICLAITELHQAGVAHTRVNCDSIRFDDGGAPVLMSFGNAEVFWSMTKDSAISSVPPGLLKQQEAVGADLAGLADTCLAVLDASCETSRWIAKSPDRDPSSFALELADRLFRSSTAAPINFASARGGSALSPIPARFSNMVQSANSAGEEVTYLVEPEPPETARMQSSARTFASVLHLPDQFVETAFEAAREILSRGPVLLITQRIRSLLAPVRKPVWAFALLVAAGVVTASLLIPSGASSSSPASKPSTSNASLAQIPVDAPAIHGEDPLTAASTLLSLRSGCFASRSVRCLEDVDQLDSMAIDSDRLQIRLMQEGGATDGSLLTIPSQHGALSLPPRLEVVERLGNTVLLTVSLDTDHSDEPSTPLFSLLIIKGEDGWRIRDLVPSTLPVG